MRAGQAGLTAEDDGSRVRGNFGAACLCIDVDDFDLPPFSQHGGLGRVHQLFGAELPKVIEALNRELVA